VHDSCLKARIIAAVKNIDARQKNEKKKKIKKEERFLRVLYKSVGHGEVLAVWPI
jgi:hypothetical protein